VTRRNRHYGNPGVRGVLIYAVLTVAALTGASPANAQTAGLQVTSVSTQRWPVLEVTATVLDESGQPITGLSPAAFGANIDGVQLPLQGLQTTSDPGVGIAVVLTFDVSGSMEGAPLENARAAGRALVDQLGPADQAAVISFSDQPVVVQPFTPDKAVLAGAIDSLVIGGNTSLYAAVQESVLLADGASLPRRAIVLLSDGQDNVSTDPESALASVEAGSAVFMSIGLGDAIDEDYLARLAASGRGLFRVAPTAEGLTALYQETAQVLRQQYVLTLDATGIDPAQANGKTIQVQATVGGATLIGAATLTLPPGLLATPVVTAAPSAVPTPAPQTQPAAESSSGGSVLPYVLLAVAGSAVLSAGGFLAWRRRRRRSGEEAPTRLERLELEHLELENRPLAYPTIERAVPDGSGAWLETPDRQVPLGDTPVTIGFTSDCLVMLANGTGSRTERVRIWLRDGSYMLHNLSRTGTVTIAGRSVTWAVLEDGDEIRIGGQTLVFRAAATAPEI
jgi:VWFA-related protein